MEGLYLIHTREFINNNSSIYKIGRSGNLQQRVLQYPNGSIVLFLHICKQSPLCEKKLIDIFKQKFIQEKYYGYEYFNGDVYEMINVMYEYIKEHNKKCIKEETEEKEKKEKKENKKNKENKINDGNGNINNNILDNVIGNFIYIKKEVKEKVKEEVKKQKKTTIGNIKDRTCPKCSKHFKYPTMLKTHFKNSFHCLMNDNEIDLYFFPNQIKCNKCCQVFSQKSSLYRHQRQKICS